MEMEHRILKNYVLRHEEKTEELSLVKERKIALRNILNGNINMNTNTTVVTTNAFDLTQAVRNTVADFMVREQSFSKHDITTAVRRSNPGQNIPHDNVKVVVEDVMNTSDWDMTHNGQYTTYQAPTCSDDSCCSDDCDDCTCNISCTDDDDLSGNEAGVDGD